MITDFIVWAPDPEIFSLGSIHVRWYGLMFALGFLLSQQIMFYMFRTEGKPERDVESLTFFMVIATVLGARLGHVFFYEPEKYLAHPIDILKIWEGGLASHGAAIGILTALYLYANYYIKISFSEFTWKKRKRPEQSYLWIVDRIVIVVALTGCLIRFGNFMNSEIVGKPTDTDYGVVFGRTPELLVKAYGQDLIEHADVVEVEPADLNQAPEEALVNQPVQLAVEFSRGVNEEQARQLVESVIWRALQDERSMADLVPVGNAPLYRLTADSGVFTAHILADGVPRHPAQLYESLSSLLIFFLLFAIWYRYKQNTPEGLLLGIFLIILFGLRFVYEFFKENQVEFEDELALNMGQILSIPLVLAGIFLLVRVARQQKRKPEKLTNAH